MAGNQKKSDVITIKKDTLITILCTALFAFALLFMAYNITQGFNSGQYGSTSELFKDELLNVSYKIPTGDWQLATFDENDINTIREVLQKSDLNSNYYNIETDALAEEIVSSLWLNVDSTGAYRQFLSFTFRAAVLYSESLESDAREAMIQEQGVSAESVEILESSTDSSGGVYLKCKVMNTASEEDSTIITTYCYQYTRQVGNSIMTATFGTLLEDDTFAKNLRLYVASVNMLTPNENGYISSVSTDGTAIIGDDETTGVVDEEHDMTRPHSHDENGNPIYDDELEDSDSSEVEDAEEDSIKDTTGASETEEIESEEVTE